MMTQKEFDQKMQEIMAQEEKFGVKIKISQLIDKDHLDCIWYGGEVGSIEYRGYKIVIGAYGEIRICGKFKGEEVEFADKNSTGEIYRSLGVDYEIDDDALFALNSGESDYTYLYYENNNWFEVNLISPDGKFIDLSTNRCSFDNVLEGDLLDCFSSVDDYFKYVDEEIKDNEYGFWRFLEGKNDNIDCTAFDLLGLLVSSGADIPEHDSPIEWDMEIIGDLVDYAKHLLGEKDIAICHPFLEGEDETPCYLGKDCKRTNCMFRNGGSK